MKYPNKKPAIGLVLMIVATGKLRDGSVVPVQMRNDSVRSNDRTDNLGQATFTVDTSTDLVELTIKVRSIYHVVNILLFLPYYTGDEK